MEKNEDEAAANITGSQPMNPDSSEATTIRMSQDLGATGGLSETKREDQAMAEDIQKMRDDLKLETEYLTDTMNQMLIEKDAMLKLRERVKQETLVHAVEKTDFSWQQKGLGARPKEDLSMPTPLSIRRGPSLSPIARQTAPSKTSTPITTTRPNNDIKPSNLMAVTGLDTASVSSSDQDEETPSNTGGRRSRDKDKGAKPSIYIKNFSGEDEDYPIDDFIETIEDVQRTYPWTELQIKAMAKSRLVGEARTLLNNSGYLESWAEMKTVLLRHFKIGKRRSYGMELLSMSRRGGEGASAFGMRVKRVARLARPKADAESLEFVIVHTFLKGMNNPELDKAVLQFDYENLDDVCGMANRMELANNGPSKPKHVNVINPTTTELRARQDHGEGAVALAGELMLRRFQKHEEELERMKQERQEEIRRVEWKPNNTTENRSQQRDNRSKSPRYNDRCYNCQGQGHIARECPSTYRDNSDRRNRSTSRGRYDRPGQYNNGYQNNNGYQQNNGYQNNNGYQQNPNGYHQNTNSYPQTNAYQQNPQGYHQNTNGYQQRGRSDSRGRNNSYNRRTPSQDSHPDCGKCQTGKDGNDPKDQGRS